ncbi:Pre-mRNA-splicing factor CWC22 homolog [Strongyloides ratti]|uniref:Pre-mRNA-splicing factor CWC22 homolog n=1 Tax=Strongyloides ratti TaxID=34506 RepID=A0A090LBP9_STRRB|nr:Pre-mRNA-splicing factor CWC22 homolog [Strongyloides ratti]CEF67167.1 Pre-mRNA-splicing factor CWC22 homolog [Strongyloides ratti]
MSDDGEITNSSEEVKNSKHVEKKECKPELKPLSINTYMPPSRMMAMMAKIDDKNSETYQRLNWELLKKKIQGAVNKLNAQNIVPVLQELMKVNIIRGKGLLVKALIQAQAFSPTFSNVYAAFVSLINSKFPNIGELLIKRLVIQFKRCYNKNDKDNAKKILQFIAHLTNQNVIHELLSLEILFTLMETPTDDSIEMSITFIREIGMKLTEISPKGITAIFERLRSILNNTDTISKRIQYMIEVLFQTRKEKFAAHVSVPEELDLIEEEDQITHNISLTEVLDPENKLNYFMLDPNFEENEKQYDEIKREILGDDDDEDEEEEEGGTVKEENEDEENNADESNTNPTPMKIIDLTDDQLTALRKSVYLTLQSSLDYQEAAHKLLKNEWKPGLEKELCNMIVDACAQQRSYENFYGNLAARFCNLKQEFQECFEEIAKDAYTNVHRFPITQLRNVAFLVSHLLFTNSISWDVLSIVRLTEKDTTPAGRIYLKFVFQTIVENMSAAKFYEKMKDPEMAHIWKGIFPRNNREDIMFAINYFTMIDLGQLTLDMRERLKKLSS